MRSRELGLRNLHAIVRPTEPTNESAEPAAIGLSDDHSGRSEEKHRGYTTGQIARCFRNEAELHVGSFAK
jgi:hypothetical protein